jgi:hypothetical protein
VTEHPTAAWILTILKTPVRTPQANAFPRPSFPLAIFCQPAQNRGRQRFHLHVGRDPAVDPAELSRISATLDG